MTLSSETVNMKNIISDAIEYARGIFARDFSGHDFYHTLRVYRIAVKIAEEEQADRDITALAALLHDVDDAKLSPGTHRSKDNAVAFLSSRGVSRDTISAICAIIDEVSYADSDSVVPATIEGKCVQDADRLDALGAIGIGRAFAYGGSRGRPMHDPDIPPLTEMSREEYQRHNSTTVNHFHEKLFRLRDMMNTEAGKAAAARRESLMREYIDEFLLEWNGEDI